MPNLSSQCPPTDNSAGANEPLKPGEQVTSLFTASLQHPHITGIWTKLSATLADLCLWIKKKIIIQHLYIMFSVSDYIFLWGKKKKKKLVRFFFMPNKRLVVHSWRWLDTVVRGAQACSPHCLRVSWWTGERRKDRKRRTACAIIHVPLQRKNAVPVAQAPCQHRMTEGTVHRITVV